MSKLADYWNKLEGAVVAMGSDEAVKAQLTWEAFGGEEAGIAYCKVLLTSLANLLPELAEGVELMPDNIDALVRLSVGLSAGTQQLYGLLHQNYHNMRREADGPKIVS